MAKTGSCERCRAADGRRTDVYRLAAKNTERELCDNCARITATVHELKPTPPAEATVDEAPEAQDEAPSRARSRKAAEEE